MDVPCSRRHFDAPDPTCRVRRLPSINRDETRAKSVNTKFFLRPDGKNSRTAFGWRAQKEISVGDRCCIVLPFNGNLFSSVPVVRYVKCLILRIKREHVSPLGESNNIVFVSISSSFVPSLPRPVFRSSEIYSVRRVVNVSTNTELTETPNHATTILRVHLSRTTNCTFRRLPFGSGVTTFLLRP